MLTWTLKTNINFVINSMFSTNFNSRLLYDDNIMVPLYNIVDGNKVKIGQGSAVTGKRSIWNRYGDETWG